MHINDNLSDFSSDDESDEEYVRAGQVFVRQLLLNLIMPEDLLFKTYKIWSDDLTINYSFLCNYGEEIIYFIKWDRQKKFRKNLQ